MIRTVVPTGSGLRELMNIPPRERLVAQSVMKPSTVRYATGSSCSSRSALRPLLGFSLDMLDAPSVQASVADDGGAL